jgi:hypothetical protein
VKAEEELNARIAKMRQCPCLLEDLNKLARMLIEAYKTNRTGQLTLHFSDGLIRKRHVSDWKEWNKIA